MHINLCHALNWFMDNTIHTYNKQEPEHQSNINTSHRTCQICCKFSNQGKKNGCDKPNTWSLSQQTLNLPFKDPNSPNKWHTDQFQTKKGESIKEKHINARAKLQRAFGNQEENSTLLQQANLKLVAAGFYAQIFKQTEPDPHNHITKHCLQLTT